MFYFNIFDKNAQVGIDSFPRDIRQHLRIYGNQAHLMLVGAIAPV